MAKASDKKVMDVAKPGEGKQQIGNKPMIIGHSGENDPMVKDNEAVKSATPIEPPSKTRKVIAPISEDHDEDSETDSAVTNDKQTKSKDAAAVDSVEVKVNKTDDSSTPDIQPKVDEAPAAESPKAVDTNASQVEDEVVQDTASEDAPADDNKQGNLDKLVSSKKYFVTIHSDHGGSSKKVLFVSFIITLLLGAAAAVALIDAEIIDLGISLPFDLI